MSQQKLGAATGQDKCVVCSKTVYFAERKEHEKQLFHVVCFNKWWKEKSATGEGLWGGKYNTSADVQPAYYRTGDSGVGPKMESGTDYKHAADAGGKKFCGQCGAASTGSKFCQGCGAAQ